MASTTAMKDHIYPTVYHHSTYTLSTLCGKGPLLEKNGTWHKRSQDVHRPIFATTQRKHHNVHSTLSSYFFYFALLVNHAAHSTNDYTSSHPTFSSWRFSRQLSCPCLSTDSQPLSPGFFLAPLSDLSLILHLDSQVRFPVRYALSVFLEI